MLFPRSYKLHKNILVLAGTIVKKFELLESFRDAQNACAVGKGGTEKGTVVRCHFSWRACAMNVLLLLLLTVYFPSLFFSNTLDLYFDGNLPYLGKYSFLMFICYFNCNAEGSKFFPLTRKCFFVCDIKFNFLEEKLFLPKHKTGSNNFLLFLFQIPSTETRLSTGHWTI